MKRVVNSPEPLKVSQKISGYHTLRTSEMIYKLQQYLVKILPFITHNR